MAILETHELRRNFGDLVAVKSRRSRKIACDSWSYSYLFRLPPGISTMTT